MKHYTYLVYFEDGRHQKINAEGKPLSLVALQAIVGGYVEMSHYPTNRKLIFLVDEEGLLKNKNRNPVYPKFVGTVILTLAANLK